MYLFLAEALEPVLMVFVVVVLVRVAVVSVVRYLARRSEKAIDVAPTKPSSRCKSFVP